MKIKSTRLAQRAAIVFVVAVFCVINVSVLAAQSQSVTLSGYVRDASTGEVLIGANIVVDGTNRGTTSNSYGFYSLTLKAGWHTIKYLYLGYRTAVDSVNLTTSRVLDVDLTPVSLEMEAIETFAERPDQNVRSLEMSVSALDVKAVESVPVVLGELDIVKSLQLLPGVTTVSEGASGFNVRGGATDQNLVLLDESPIYNASHLFGFFSVFNSDALNEVKLYKASIPAKFGGRLSSVLDIHQREGNRKAFNAEGGIGLVSSRLLVEGPLQENKGSFLLAGRRTYGDLFLSLFNNEATAYFYDLNLKANYEFDDRNRIFLSGYFGRDRFEVVDVFGNSWGNFALSMRWNHIFGERLFSNLSLVYSDYDYSLDILSDGSPFNWTAHILNYHVKTDFSYFLSEERQLDFGGGAILYGFQPGEIRPVGKSAVTGQTLDEKSAIESSAYLDYRQSLTDRLGVQAGLRFSSFNRMGRQTVFRYADDAPAVFNSTLGRYEDGVVVDSTRYGSFESIANFTALEPRVSFRFQVDDESSIKAMYNRTKQYIHLISNTTSPSPLDIWAPSGPYIKPQEADQVALGYFRNFRDNAYEASLETYFKTMRNQLDYVDGAQLLFNNTIETEILTGTGRAYGAELFIRKKTGSVTGWISYTLARTERRVRGLGQTDPGVNDGQYYPSNYDKTHDLSVTAIYEANPKWSFSANFVFSTGVPATYPNGRYEFAGVSLSQYERRNDRRLPPYHRLDLSATWKNVLRGDWTLSIYNVYNRRNASSITFRQNEQNPGVSEAVRIAIFGIVPSITYNFKI